MHFGCLKEMYHWDGSFEYPQHMFWLRNNKNNFLLRTLIWGPDNGPSWLNYQILWRIPLVYKVLMTELGVNESELPSIVESRIIPDTTFQWCRAVSITRWARVWFQLYWRVRRWSTKHVEFPWYPRFWGYYRKGGEWEEKGIEIP